MLVSPSMTHVDCTFPVLHVQKQWIKSVSSTGPFYNMTPEERIDADNRSIYVGNVRNIHSYTWIFLGGVTVLV